MPIPADLGQMERDFLSGKNPLAYIPLCQALRRAKNYQRALEICQRGLSGDPNSIAGRTLYARLLLDLAHYEEALREIARAETSAPEAMGLQVEKARCLLRLKRLEEAEETMRLLTTRNPLDPQVQLLGTELRRLRTQASSSTSLLTSRDSSPRLVRLTSDEVLTSILNEMKGQVTILSCAVIPTGAGQPALEGDALVAESAFQFYKETASSCLEVDSGTMRVGLIETDKVQLIVLVRRKTLVALCIQPTPNLGKIFHRLLMLVGQLLPESAKEGGV